MTNTEFHKEIRKIIKAALDDFSGNQLNLDSDSCKEAVSYRVATDIIENFEFLYEDKKKG
jgi:hypothetical protein